MNYISVKNIWRRLMSESPIFFRKLAVILGSVSATGIALIALKAQYPKQMGFFPDYLGGYMLTAGAVGLFLTKLTVINPEEKNIK